MEIVVLIVVYFVPAVIAGMRNHQNGGAIFALNLLLGWTLIGWVAALVWSLTASAAPVAVGAAGPPPILSATTETIERLQALRASATISEAEFQELKARAMAGSGPAVGAAADAAG
jgi:hypothetical protein